MLLENSAEEMVSRRLLRYPWGVGMGGLRAAKRLSAYVRVCYHLHIVI